MNQPAPRMSKRQFLQRSALAAAPLLLPARMFGQTAPSSTLNVGIAGAGGRSKIHVTTFSRIPGVRVAAVCDIWPKHAAERKAAVDKLNGNTDCKTFHDFREMIANPGIDIVAVTAPDHWHSLIAIEAAKHGKHIYLEKPFSYSIAEGAAVAAAIRRKGVIVQHGTQQRSIRYFQRAAWLARHGYIGDLEVAYAISPEGPQDGDPTPVPPPEGHDYDFFTGPAPVTPCVAEMFERKGTPGWYFTSAFCSGWVTAWGSHHVDSAQMALGKDHEAPVRVEAAGSYPAGGAWDAAYEWHAEFTYADGKKLVYLTPNRPQCPKIDANIVIVGSKGWVAASRERFFSNPPHLAETAWPRDDSEFQLIDKGADADHFVNFINAIRRGERLNAPIEIGRLSTSLCHLTGIAMELQRPLEWDGASERFPSDATANRMLYRPMRAPWKLEV